MVVGLPMSEHVSVDFAEVELRLEVKLHWKLSCESQ